ncbi:MAG: glycolate oxidase subunit GlcE, partial [Rhodoferax sp.]|nr:glycolate oxidase subunit GlcE [Rhodoferax sp.]
APVLALPAQPLVEWHGGLRWLWAPAAAAAELQALARAAGGTASAFADPRAAGQAGNAAGSLQTDSPTLNAISQRLKTSFDPQGLFNPGLI